MGVSAGYQWADTYHRLPTSPEKRRFITSATFYKQEQGHRLNQASAPSLKIFVPKKGHAANVMNTVHANNFDLTET